MTELTILPFHTETSKASVFYTDSTLHCDRPYITHLIATGGHLDGIILVQPKMGKAGSRNRVRSKNQARLSAGLLWRAPGQIDDTGESISFC